MFNSDGSVEIYHDNTKRLETTDDGVKITGGIQDKDGGLGQNLQLLQSTGSQLTWADPDSVVIGESSKVKTQDVNETGITTNTDFYLTFVDSNNATATSEFVYTDGGITYNAAQDHLTISGGVSIAGTITYDDVTNVDSLGIVTARKGVRITQGGLIISAGISTFSANIIPGSNEGANIGSSTDYRWNEVYAKEYYGTFKGTIDPGTSTISVASSLTDILGVDDNILWPKDPGADRIVFWDETATKLTLLSVGTGLEIDGTELKASSDAGKTYTLPLTGTAGASGNAKWTLTPNSGTSNSVQLNAGTNVSISALDTTGDDYAFTIDVADGGGLSLDATVTDVLDLSSGTLSADDLSHNRIIYWDEPNNKLTYLDVGIGVTIENSVLKATSSAGKTYTIDGVNAAPNFTLRLSDNADPVVNDDVTFTAGANISFGSTSTSGVTINAIAGAGMDTDSTTADVLTITGATLSADDPGADRIIFWDDSETKLEHLSIDSNTLEIDGTELKVKSSAVGNTYDLTVEQTGGTDANPVLRLGDGTTNDDITMIGSGSVTVTRNSSTQFTIDGSAAGGLTLDSTVTDILDLTGSTLSADDPGADRIVFWDDSETKLEHLSVGSGLQIVGTELSATGAGTLSNVAVKQYSDNATTRTERTCTKPIGVVVDSGTATIGIGTTSNAYGARYIQSDDPTPSDGGSFTTCEGDIWYDTSDVGSGGGITVIEESSTVGTTATIKVLDFKGTSVTATASGSDTAIITVVDNPVGTVIWYAGSTAPTGYLKCNGDAIANGSGTTQSITADFSALYAIVGTNLPDLRGEFVRGWDDSRGVDSGRTIRSSQDDAWKNHQHIFGGDDSVGADMSPIVWPHAGSAYNYNRDADSNAGNDGRGYVTSNNTTGANNTTTYGDTETRPRNIALLACIKY